MSFYLQTTLDFSSPVQYLRLIFDIFNYIWEVIRMCCITLWTVGRTTKNKVLSANVRLYWRSLCRLNRYCHMNETEGAAQQDIQIIRFLLDVTTLLQIADLWVYRLLGMITMCWFFVSCFFSWLFHVPVNSLVKYLYEQACLHGYVLRGHLAACVITLISPGIVYPCRHRIGSLDVWNAGLWIDHACVRFIKSAVLLVQHCNANLSQSSHQIK